MAVEMSMIGFMVGTCIAFFVVIGDLAPPIVAYIVDVVPSENLRIFTMLGKFFDSKIEYPLRHFLTPQGVLGKDPIMG